MTLIDSYHKEDDVEDVEQQHDDQEEDNVAKATEERTVEERNTQQHVPCGHNTTETIVVQFTVDYNNMVLHSLVQICCVVIKCCNLQG